jgi:PAS domain-containing protein
MDGPMKRAAFEDDLVFPDALFRAMIDAAPTPMFVVTHDVRILLCNQAASGMLGSAPSQVLRRRTGEVLHCVNACQTPAGCGKSALCKDCAVRKAVSEAFEGGKIHRQRAKLAIQKEGGTQRPIFMLVSASPFNFQDQRLVLLTLEDLGEVLQLGKLIPICASCKKVRNEENSWDPVDAYFQNHWDVDFTHSYCPVCASRLIDEAKAYTGWKDNW